MIQSHLLMSGQWFHSLDPDEVVCDLEAAVEHIDHGNLNAALNIIRGIIAEGRDIDDDGPAGALVPNNDKPDAGCPGDRVLVAA